MLIIGAISLAATVVDAGQEKRKPNKWVPIIGIKTFGAKAYLDANSFLTNVVGKEGQYNSAEILVSYDSPTEVTVGGKKYTIRSMARSMVVECKTGLSAPVFDVYFKEAMPTRDSLPVTGLEWPSDVQGTYSVLNKNSILYGVMCPVYI
jgi:hypothetical protein